jgi:hypothetical protein
MTGSKCAEGSRQANQAGHAASQAARSPRVQAERPGVGAESESESGEVDYRLEYVADAMGR